MRTRELKLKNKGRQARSVLECGSPLLLFNGGNGLAKFPGANRRRAGALWRAAERSGQFKTWWRFVALIVFATLPWFSMHAQTYSIDWHKISGGGGTSTGGGYSITGTIGQHDANPQFMSGGNYSLTGGFWSFLSVVPMPGAPKLKIFLTATNTAVVSWPSPSIGFALQQNTNLSTTNWVTPSENVIDDGANKFIIVNPPSGNRFYRLFR
jgi:hypothetical protein